MKLLSICDRLTGERNLGGIGNIDFGKVESDRLVSS
jgi:hypothetical protein